MNVLRKCWLLFVLSLCCSAAPASAQTIIGNLPATGDPGGTNLTNMVHKAVSFTMGPSSYSLSAAVLRLQVFSGAVPIVELRTDSGGPDPGITVLASLSNPSFGSGIAAYSFTPTAPVTLLADTKYWLYVRGANSNHTFWSGSSPTITPTGPGANFGGYRQTNNNAASWSANSFFNSFELQGSPIVAGTDVVPEPAAVVLFLPALALIALQRRRRK